MNRRWLLIIFATVVFVALPAAAIALNTLATGFQVGSSQTKIDAHGVCHNVQATDGKSYFVPTNTAGEWSAFRTNKPSGVTLSSCSLNKWVQVANMPGIKFRAATASLADGRVIVCGGNDGISELNRCDIYNPTSNDWTQAADLPQVKSGASGTLLSDGRVLVCGGNIGFTRQNRCDTYNPATNAWTQVANLPESKFDHASVRLSNGRVLVCGGVGVQVSKSCHVYNPASNSWASTAALPSWPFSISMSMLPDNRVLACYSTYGNGFAIDTITCAKYNYSTNSWTGTTEPTNITIPIYSGAYTMYSQSGNILCDAFGNCSVFESDSDTWAPIASFTPARTVGTFGADSSGGPLLCGGYVPPTTNRCDMYFP